ncbi:phytanoyl-CoA dioxygenase family protein [Methylocystis rosea]|uniref:phytanoyl-CoA dioxygenase family protein n=1 Tax=Methylocystis rosea TaxID=173366 RepID=UPI00036D0978|nr:phytanoyl-CoA dioxygenase family protein [Methylocystis rosea]
MEIPKNIFQYDWAAMSATDQRAFFAKNGFLVIPQLFTPEEVDLMHKEIEQYGLAEKKIDMSEAFCSAPSFAPMVDHPKLVSALTSILGSNFICFKGAYVPKHSKQGVSDPHRTALHVDYGILEREGDYRNSNALWVNVACYLSDMTFEHAPFAVVPGSHNYFHLEPGTDMESLKEEAVTLLAKAGDAILFLHNTVHAGGSNVSGYTQHILFCSYRAAWARHIGRVTEWPKQFVENSPPSRQRLISGLNAGDAQEELPAVVKRYVPASVLKKSAETLSTLGKYSKAKSLTRLGDRLWAAYEKRVE